MTFFDAIDDWMLSLINTFAEVKFKHKKTYIVATDMHGDLLGMCNKGNASDGLRGWALLGGENLDV